MSEGKLTLIHRTIGEREFEQKHAERILKMQNNGGWELAKEKALKNESDVAGKRNKRKVKKSAETRDNQQSDSPREQT